MTLWRLFHLVRVWWLWITRSHQARRLDRLEAMADRQLRLAEQDFIEVCAPSQADQDLAFEIARLDYRNPWGMMPRLQLRQQSYEAGLLKFLGGCLGNFFP